MLFPVQGTHIVETAYYLPVFNILIKTPPMRGMAAVLLHFSTGVRAYMVLHTFHTLELKTAYYPPKF